MSLFDDAATIRDYANPSMQFKWNKPRKNNYAPFSLKNEVATLKKLAEQVEEQKKKYVRPFAEDLELLSKPEQLTPHAINGLRIIIEEKTILRSITEATSLLLNILALKTKEDIEKTKNIIPTLPEHLREYVSTVAIPLLEKEIK